MPSRVAQTWHRVSIFEEKLVLPPLKRKTDLQRWRSNTEVLNPRALPPACACVASTNWMQGQQSKKKTTCLKELRILLISVMSDQMMVVLETGKSRIVKQTRNTHYEIKQTKNTRSRRTWHDWETFGGGRKLYSTHGDVLQINSTVLDIGRRERGATPLSISACLRGMLHDLVWGVWDICKKDTIFRL